MKVGFTVPRIQPKERPRITRNGHVYTPPRTAKYEEEVQFIYNIQCGHIFDGAVGVEMRFYIQKPRTVKRTHPTVVPDADNLAKSVLDGLNPSCKSHGAWRDDSQVIELTVTKQYTEEPDRVEVEIWDIEKEAD